MRGRKPYYHEPIKTSITCERFKKDLCERLDVGPTGIFDAGMNWIIDMAIENEDHRLTKEDIQTYQNLLNKRLNKAIREKESAEAFTSKRLDTMSGSTEPLPEHETPVYSETDSIRKQEEFNDKLRKVQKLLDPLFGKDECVALDRGLDTMPTGMTEVGYYKGILQVAAGKLAAMRSFNPAMEHPENPTEEDIMALQSLTGLEDIMWRWLQDRIIA